MAYTLWPPTMPQQQTESLRYWTESGVARTENEIGPQKARRRSTLVRRFFSTDYNDVSGDQLEDFEAFLATIQGGALPFQWEHPVYDTPVLCTLLEEPEWELTVPGAVAARRWGATIKCEIVADIEVEE